MVRKQVLETIKKHRLIENNEHIVIGLSGGPDSVCLFHILNSLAEEMHLTLHPVHINHKFRPGAAEEDQHYAEKLAESWGWKCKTYIYRCEEIAKELKIGSEEAGRMVRYDSFAETAENLVESGIPREKIKIAVAQNADDQAETIMFRILRGTGIDGISGISYMRTDSKNNLIIRPILDVFKADIIKYCEENELEPRIDHTNKEAFYTRNKIRLNLLPQIEREFNSNIKETLIRMGKSASADSEYLWDKALEEYSAVLIEESKTHILLRGEKLRRLPDAVKTRVISKAFSKIGLDEDVGYVHFEKSIEILFNDKPSARMDLPKGFYITKVYDDLKIARETEMADKQGKTEETDCTEHALKIRIMDYDKFQSLDLPKDKYAAFDADLLEEEYGEEARERICIRTRKSGDYIYLQKGRKKIQDYMVDMKIPKDARDKVMLVAIGREILWVIPCRERGRYSGKYKLCKDTKRLISIEIISGI